MTLMHKREEIEEITMKRITLLIIITTTITIKAKVNLDKVIGEKNKISLPKKDKMKEN